MAIFGPGYSGPKEMHYLFVDGGSLRGRLKNWSEKYFGDAILDIDFGKVKGEFTKVFYYDALPVREKNETEVDYNARIAPNKAVLDSAAAIDGVHVYEGDARRRRRRGLEQKKVDVMLTVDMLTHSFRKNMHQATLLTGDNDFKPLVDALVQDGMFVTLWFPTGETSAELIQAADARRPLNMRAMRDLLTDESQELFCIPHIENVNPTAVLGPVVKSWEIRSKKTHLCKWKGQYLLAQSVDDHNRLKIGYSNYDLLRDFCRDSMNIEMPESPP